MVKLLDSLRDKAVFMSTIVLKRLIIKYVARKKEISKPLFSIHYPTLSKVSFYVLASLFYPCSGSNGNEASLLFAFWYNLFCLYKASKPDLFDQWPGNWR